MNTISQSPSSSSLTFQELVTFLVAEKKKWLLTFSSRLEKDGLQNVDDFFEDMIGEKSVEENTEILKNAGFDLEIKSEEIYSKRFLNAILKELDTVDPNSNISQITNTLLTRLEHRFGLNISYLIENISNRCSDVLRLTQAPSLPIQSGL